MGKMFFYAVAAGRKPGVYDTWEQCEEQVKGFQGAKFKKFISERDAAKWTGLEGKQAETIRAAGGNLSSSSAILAVRPNRENIALANNQRANTAPPTSQIASSSRVVLDQQKKIETDTREALVVFCDGACKGNGKNGQAVAGLGVWWGKGDPRNLAERVPAVQTNNRAELLAIVRVLERLPEDGRALVIKTDSRYSIDCATNWCTNWIRNGWRKRDGKPVENKELIHYLVTLLELRKVLGQKIELVHVRGHVGIEGNEMADGQANIGATLPEIPDDPDWASLRNGLEQRILHLTNTQIQGPSTSTIEQTALSTQAIKTVNATTVSSEEQGVPDAAPNTPSQKLVAEGTFTAELTADDYVDADDILSSDDLDAEFNSA